MIEYVVISEFFDAGGRQWLPGEYLTTEDVEKLREEQIWAAEAAGHIERPSG